MLTQTEFNAQVARDGLEVGENYGELLRQAQLFARVLGIPYIFAKSTTPVTRNSTNTSGTGGVDDNEEVTLATITIPAGTLKDKLSIWIHAFWRSTNSANAKQLIIRVNGTSVGSISPTTVVGNQQSIVIHSNNALNSQKAINSTTADFGGASTIQDLTFDNNSDVTITLTARWTAAVASESITLEEYMVMFLPG